MQPILNTLIPLKFIDVKEDDLRVHGAKVSLDGRDLRLGMQRIRILQRFNFTYRDDKGGRVRPKALMSDEEVADLERYGFAFEPSELAGHWYPTIPWEIGSFYRQGYH